MKKGNIKISIEAARVNAKLLQKEVAKRLNVRRETYARYERGEASMSIDQAVLFARIVNLPLHYIRFSLPKNIA